MKRIKELTYVVNRGFGKVARIYVDDKGNTTFALTSETHGFIDLSNNAFNRRMLRTILKRMEAK